MRRLSMALAAFAGLFGACGVALAAVGAHLSGNPSVTTSAHFLLFHAGALVAICGFVRPQQDKLVLVAGGVIALGVVLFSGDLALRSLTGLTPLRMAAPTGGLLMIAGWASQAVALPLAMGRSRARQS